MNLCTKCMEKEKADFFEKWIDKLSNSAVAYKSGQIDINDGDLLEMLNEYDELNKSRGHEIRHAYTDRQEEWARIK